LSPVTVAEMLRPEQIAPLDARVLLRAVLRVGDAYIAAHPERQLTDDQREQYQALLQRRRAGEPIAYLTGEREFYSLSFTVTPAVLIPRPETEMLVDLALERAWHGRTFRVLDLATGSGCVAVAIAKNCKHAELTATDVSRAALALARANAAQHGAAIELLESDWFEELAARRFDAIVANPPYIAAHDPYLAEGDARFEPREALVAGPTGYECIDTIAAQSSHYLNPGGWLLFEHGCDQAARVRARLNGAGFSAVFTVRDLAGLERVSGGRV
jgi:release factor glutamine methyltransferase